jgi:hypothetical protein
MPLADLADDLAHPYIVAGQPLTAVSAVFKYLVVWLPHLLIPPVALFALG